MIKNRASQHFYSSVRCSEGVLTLAALRVVGAEAEEARLALVTAWPFHVGLAAALTGHHAQGGFGVAVAHPTVLRAVWVAIASCRTHRWLCFYSSPTVGKNHHYINFLKYYF